MPESYDRLRIRLQEVWDIERADAVLGWDEQVNLPSEGGPDRGRQSATLGRIAHSLFTDDETGRLLDALEREGYGQGERDEDFVVRATRRDYDRARKLPPELVERHHRVASEAFEAWVRARRAKDFALFADPLRRMVEVVSEEADAIDHPDGRYTGLLDLHGDDFTARELDGLFSTLRVHLTHLTGEISQREGAVDDGFLRESWDEGRQWEATQKALDAFRWPRGRTRVDRSIHPFTTSFSIRDVRITTRIDPDYFPMGFFGSLHEMGHGLYELGLPERFQGTPAGNAASHAVHESQSRLYENLVGRSRPFWEFFFPTLQALFPERLKGRTAEDMYRAVNHSAPSLIRVEADEVTYNLHIILRYELERELLEGDLKVESLPSAWNAKVKELLGITPPDDLDGVLQDIHWSGGGFASFPSYTLGNVIGAQIMESVRKDLPDLDEQLGRGDFTALSAWLASRLYQEGGKYRTKEIVKRVTGRELTTEPYLTYITNKYRALYGF